MEVSKYVVGIGSFISYLNVALIYCKLTDKKFKAKWYYYLSLIVMATINAVVMPLLPVFVKPIYNLSCFALSIYFNYKVNIRTILYYVFSIWFVGMILDIFSMTLFSLYIKSGLKSHPSFGMFVISIFIQLLLYLFYCIKFVKRGTIKLKEKLDLISNVVLIFLLMIFTVVLFGIMVYIKMSSIRFMTIFIFFLVTTIFLMSLMIKIIVDKNVFKITIDNLLNNNKFYVDVNNKDRVFRHNIIHRLNGIKSVGDKKVDMLVNDMIKEYHLGNNNNCIIDDIPVGINGLVNQIIYGRKNSKLNIVINNYLKSNLFDVLTPRKYNKLCETLSICLDNSVMASLRSKDKVLQIVIDENTEYILIKMINTFDSSLDVDKLGLLNYTTKKEGHGLGLYSLFGKRDVFLTTNIINDLFETKIKIKKNF